MQTTNLTVEVLLLENDRADGNKIEHLLTQVKSQVFQINRFPAIENARKFLQHHRPNIVLFVSKQNKNSNLDTLLKLKKFDRTSRIPIIAIVDRSYDLSFIPEQLTDYIIWDELSGSLLIKSIQSAIKHYKNSQELELLRQENTELGSQLLETKNLFETIIDNSSTLIWMCDERENNTFFNQAWSRLGQPKATIINGNWMQNIHLKDLPKCQQQFEQALAETRGFTIDYRLKSSNHKYRWMSNYAVPQFDLDGSFQGFVGYCFDITARKATEHQLIQRAKSDRLLAQITQKIHASLELEQILQTTVVELNQFLLAEKIQIDRVDGNSQLTLLFESKLIGQNFSCDMAESQQVPQALFQINIARLSAGQIVDRDLGSILLVPIICKQKLWGLLCIEEYSFARTWTREEIGLLERVAMEFSVAIEQARLYQQLEKANQKLEQLSVVDDLTKIANRRKFDRYLTSEWTRLAREQNCLALILCDIDRFKLYNDTYGHLKGDRCLQQVAMAISGVIKRPADFTGSLWRRGVCLYFAQYSSSRSKIFSRTGTLTSRRSQNSSS